MKKGDIMYFFSYLINIFKPRNWSLALYSLANYFIIFFLFYIFNIFDLSSLGITFLNNMTMNGIIGILINLVFKFIVLSPLGEAIGRFRYKCKKIDRYSETEWIYQIFDNVYEKSKAKSKHIGNKVKLYLVDDDEVNAFAYGKNTISVTVGLLNIDDDEMIESVIAHEFGHIANQDSFRKISIDNTSFMLSVFVILAFAAISVFDFITSILLATKNGLLSFLSFFAVLFSFVLKIAMLVIYSVWIWIGRQLVFLTSKRDEYKADEYATRLGYGEKQLMFFEEFGNPHTKRSIFAFFSDEHPSDKNRVERISKVMNSMAEKA